jgi:rubrerythrin
MRSFKSLDEQEILALAIALEEEDARIYGDFAAGLEESAPATAKILNEMREEEDGHRHRLIELHRQKFGEHIPHIRRQDIKGFVERRPIWLVRPLGLAAVRKQVEVMEWETRRFYESAIRQSTDAGIRQLLGDLAEEERRHTRLAESLESAQRESGALDEEAATRNRMFVLQVIQPGLAGLMDGSVSTLAPLFAAAFATRESHQTFVVGLAASVGAGISMGFAEALSDHPRHRLRADDGRRRPGTHAAVSHPELQNGHGDRGDRRRRGASRDLLDSAPLYGHAAYLGAVSSDGRRIHRLPNGNLDRQLVAVK